MGKVYFMIAIICILLVMFLCIADYALFSYKCALIKKAIDFASDAGAMEVASDAADTTGLGIEMHEVQKDMMLSGVRIDMTKAESAFWTVFESNTGILRSAASANTMFVTACWTGTTMEYCIKKGTTTMSGNVTAPDKLEPVINSVVALLFPNSVDASVIKVNGNVRTEQFKERPMFMAFLKNWQINGLFTKREATFITFKGAKLERPL